MRDQHNKAGHQSKENPYKFIMSTASVDRMGDIVRQDWDLKEFGRNPVALFNHSANMVIGTWDNVRVESGRLVGQLRLAQKGTSRIVDEIRSLLEQRILKAVSVGFTSTKATPINPKKPYHGQHLSGNSLLECSLVSVPANSEALLAKSLSPELRAMLTGRRATPNALKLVKKMNLSEQISARKAALADIESNIETLKSQAEAENRDMNSGELAQYKTLLDDRDSSVDNLVMLERDMAKAATRAAPASPTHRSIAHVETKREKGELVFGALGNMLKGHILNKSAEQMASENYAGDKDMQAMTSAIVKAAIDPAMTTVPEWAGDLVRQGYGDFMDLLKPVSVLPRVPGARHVFGGNGSIKIPARSDSPQINGDWVAEGAPIPVKKLGFTSITMTPKKVGVISTFTREIMMASNPQIEGIIRQAMLDDTAQVLDTTFLDNTAGSTVRPAGLKNIAGAQTAASTGATAANILTDIGVATAALIAAHMGNSAVWIMNPKHRIGLSGIMLANGAFLFRDEVNAGTFAGYPVILSNNVPVGDVFLVDSNALTFANNFGPEFSVSNQATLHMESDVTKVSPIVDAGTGTAGATAVDDVANPVRSLFQTDTYGIRMVWGLDWAAVRPKGVFVLTSVAW